MSNAAKLYSSEFYHAYRQHNKQHKKRMKTFAFNFYRFLAVKLHGKTFKVRKNDKLVRAHTEKLNRPRFKRFHSKLELRERLCFK